MTTLDPDEKLDKLYRKLDKIDRKIHREDSGDLKAAALLIERRHIEEKIWALDQTLEQR